MNLVDFENHKTRELLKEDIVTGWNNLRGKIIESVQNKTFQDFISKLQFA